MTLPNPDTGLQCPKCGYNLTAITSSTCPECGERFVITNQQGYLAKFPPSKLRKYAERSGPSALS